MKPTRPIWFSCSPDGAGWIVRAMAGSEMETAAWSGCPWDAAARCAGYMVYRCRKKRK